MTSFLGLPEVRWAALSLALFLLALITGALHAPANATAARELATQILPRVRRRLPDASRQATIAPGAASHPWYKTS